MTILIYITYLCAFLKYYINTTSMALNNLYKNELRIKTHFIAKTFTSFEFENV